jgi:hypothetical protein
MLRFPLSEGEQHAFLLSLREWPHRFSLSLWEKQHRFSLSLWERVRVRGDRPPESPLTPTLSPEAVEREIVGIVLPQMRWRGRW